MSITSPFYYLYKMSIKGHPEYYIGVTDDHERRLREHRGQIYPLIKKIRRKQPVQVKIPAYLVFAKSIAHGKNLIQMDRSILENIKFEILKQDACWRKIRLAETQAIGYAEDPFCLNTQKRSHYKPKINHARKTI